MSRCMRQSSVNHEKENLSSKHSNVRVSKNTSSSKKMYLNKVDHKGVTAKATESESEVEDKEFDSTYYKNDKISKSSENKKSPPRRKSSSWLKIISMNEIISAINADELMNDDCDDPNDIDFVPSSEELNFDDSIEKKCSNTAKKYKNIENKKTLTTREEYLETHENAEILNETIDLALSVKNMQLKERTKSISTPIKKSARKVKPRKRYGESSEDENTEISNKTTSSSTIVKNMNLREKESTFTPRRKSVRSAKPVKRYGDSSDDEKCWNNTSKTTITPSVQNLRLINTPRSSQKIPAFEETRTNTPLRKSMRSINLVQYYEAPSEDKNLKIRETPKRAQKNRFKADSQNEEVESKSTPLRAKTMTEDRITETPKNLEKESKRSRFSEVKNEFNATHALDKIKENSNLLEEEDEENSETDSLEYRSMRISKRKMTKTSSQVNEANMSPTKKRSTSQQRSTLQNNVTPQKRKSPVSENVTPRTKLTKSFRNIYLTPSVQERTVKLVKPMTPLQEARNRLHVSVVPKSLPCREVEFNDIYGFLYSSLTEKSGGCMYISGVPGTGKTATVNEAIKCLQKLVDKGELDKFDFAEINGMKLTEPKQAYTQILKQLTGKVAPWEQSMHELEKIFVKSIKTKKPMTLLLVDELDLLHTRRQDVVYNLLDWPISNSAHLIVITIANTMDLPEKVFAKRVHSRLGMTRLTFQPYNFKQLTEIVLNRLKDSNSFRSEAVQLVARKVAAVSGDARRALDICRRATEVTERRNGDVVSLNDVSQALTEMIANPKVQAIKHCSRMERLFLQAVSAEITRTGVQETIFKKVYEQFQLQCVMEGLQVPNITLSLGICGRLGASRLILCEHSRADIYQKILLNVSPDDIHFAVQKSNPQ